MTRSAAAYGDRLHAHRHLVAPLGVALADQSAALEGQVEQGSPPGRHERPDDVVDEGGRAGRGPHLAGRPEAAALPVRQPQHQVGEGEVGDDLPVRHQQLQPGHVLLVEVRVAAHQIGQGRHGAQVRWKPRGLDALASPLSANGRMARMTRAYWSQVKAGGLAVPEDRPLAELTTELTTMLGSPDPQMRDGLAYPTLATWIDRGVYDDLIVGLGDGMAAGLTVGLGEQDTDSVFRRAFSVLVLAECVDRDNEQGLVPGVEAARVGRQHRDLVPPRARRARVRPREGLGPRRRPRRGRHRRARPVAARGPQRADRAARRHRRPGAGAGRRAVRARRARPDGAGDHERAAPQRRPADARRAVGRADRRRVPCTPTTADRPVPDDRQRRGVPAGPPPPARDRAVAARDPARPAAGR